MLFIVTNKKMKPAAASTTTKKKDTTVAASTTKVKESTSAASATNTKKQPAAASATNTKKQPHARAKMTPYKAKDLVPIVRRAIAKNPCLSNKDMASLLEPYGKSNANWTVFTDSLLQNTRALAREEVFGDPATNATYAMALKCELEKRGHYVHVGTVNRQVTLQKIYDVVWEDYKACNTTVSETKKDFCRRWCEENTDELYMSLGDEVDAYSFVTEFFFSPSTAKESVPRLQRVFQADAAHTAFGKYTLFSMYGTSANGTMFPVALGLVFGNETKASWVSFCKFVADTHPTINEATVTIITDQCKGSIAAFDEYFPNAFQFNCSYHRAANILLNCKGGKTKHSPHWLFKTLVNCGSMQSLQRVREKYSVHLSATQLKYLNDTDDEQQYPAARCAMGNNIFLYDHEASSGVESMNQANKPARNMAAVDVVNAIMLLLNLERYVIVSVLHFQLSHSHINAVHFEANDTPRQ